MPPASSAAQIIIDSHAHIFRVWPWRQRAPDSEVRGRAERLVSEMDQAGVAHALVIGAIDSGNADNNIFAREACERHGERLLFFPSVDPYGSPNYHMPGAAERLVRAVETTGARGFLHFLYEDYEWLQTTEGDAFLAAAERRQLIFSIPASPAGLPTLAAVAKHYAGVTFICHHLGGARQMPVLDSRAWCNALLQTVDVSNLWFKLTGFHHLTETPWRYPHSDLQWIPRMLYEVVGARRLCWGSDFPVVEVGMTYRQSLEIVRSHAAWLPVEEQALVLGGNLNRLLFAA